MAAILLEIEPGKAEVEIGIGLYLEFMQEQGYPSG